MPQSIPPPPALRPVLGFLVDIVALVVVGALVWSGKVSSDAGVAFFAACVSGHFAGRYRGGPPSSGGAAGLLGGSGIGLVVLALVGAARDVARRARLLALAFAALVLLVSCAPATRAPSSAAPVSSPVALHPGAQWRSMFMPGSVWAFDPDFDPGDPALPMLDSMGQPAAPVLGPPTGDDDRATCEGWVRMTSRATGQPVLVLVHGLVARAWMVEQRAGTGAPSGLAIMDDLLRWSGRSGQRAYADGGCFSVPAL